MNFQRQSREEVSVNLTPLIDIVFLLLIFFMVSTTFTKEAYMNLSLPESSAEITQAEQEVIEIIIDAAGQVSVNGRALLNNQLDTLKSAITKVLGTSQKLPVLITADAQTPHEMVVRTMDAAGQLGLVNLSITTRQSSQ